ncbi:hypothetical protein SANA_08180 [Gottschalkiaceae bacterium SANA]|nr:hypothetical protein SANA_08180 [Gottschalkiaceae bacterium SANA]
MFYAILIFFSFLESIIGFSFMSASIMKFREPVKKRIIVALSFMILSMSVFFYALVAYGSQAVSGFAIVIILIAFSIWYVICSGDPLFVSLFHFLTFVNIYISISYIGDDLAMQLEGVQKVLLYITIRTLIYAGLIFLLFKWVRPRVHRLVEILDQEWRAATLVPFVFLLLQILLLYYPTPYWNWDSNSWYKTITVVVYVLFVVVYYLLYIQANAIVEKYLLEKKQLLMSQQEKLWESELERQKLATELAFEQRHNMHHHNAVISGMLQSQQIEELKRYMKSCDAALDVKYSHDYCKNPIANSIFNLYADRAEKENIRSEFYVSIPEDIGIENVDLTCVLGNALENALEGCLRLAVKVDKEIIVTTKFIDRRLRIQVENTCRTDIKFKEELPVTQKQGGGTGTKSILYTAEEYDGAAGFSVRNGSFITQIVMNAR